MYIRKPIFGSGELPIQKLMNSGCVKLLPKENNKRYQRYTGEEKMMFVS